MSRETKIEECMHVQFHTHDCGFSVLPTVASLPCYHRRIPNGTALMPLVAARIAYARMYIHICMR